MQAAKRYGIVIILSILLIIGYLNLPRSGISVRGQVTGDHVNLATANRAPSPKGVLSLGSSKEEARSQEKQPSLIKTPLKTELRPAAIPDPAEEQHEDKPADHAQSDDPPEAVPHNEVEEVVEVEEVEPHLKQLVSDSGLSIGQLDKLYNLSTVRDVDLHNVTFLDQYYQYNYQIIEDRVNKRMENVGRVCEEIRFKKTTNYNLYQFNELGVTWCPVFKSGSTTWRNYFIKKYVSNPPQEYTLNLLKSRQLVSSMKGRTENNKQYFRMENEKNIRFSIVRHPFARLVSHVKSSGRDHEMVNQRGLWIESAIVAGRSHLLPDPRKIFKFKSELYDYFVWLKNGKPGGKYEEGSPDNPFLNPPYPKLSELVSHIMQKRRSGRDWDGHWMPAHEFCNICIHKFQYIIRLEEEPLELWYLAEKLGLWEDRTTFLNRANNSSNRETEMEEVWREIGKLSKEQIDFLGRHFDVDFKMFGYRRGKE